MPSRWDDRQFVISSIQIMLRKYAVYKNFAGISFLLILFYRHTEFFLSSFKEQTKPFIWLGAVGLQ